MKVFEKYGITETWNSDISSAETTDYEIQIIKNSNKHACTIFKKFFNFEIKPNELGGGENLFNNGY